MKLTDYDMERVRHLDTRRALLASHGAMLDRDAQALEAEIKARLGIVGSFGIAPDGTVTVVDVPVVDLAHSDTDAG